MKPVISAAVVLALFATSALAEGMNASSSRVISSSSSNAASAHVYISRSAEDNAQADDDRDYGGYYRYGRGDGYYADSDRDGDDRPLAPQSDSGHYPWGKGYYRQEPGDDNFPRDGYRRYGDDRPTPNWTKPSSDFGHSRDHDHDWRDDDDHYSHGSGHGWDQGRDHSSNRTPGDDGGHGGWNRYGGDDGRRNDSHWSHGGHGRDRD